MNFTVNSASLAEELRLLSKITPTKPVIPVLSNVLIRANDQLHMSVTDTEVGLSTTCAATINEPGAITLPAKKLLELVEQLSADVTIVLEKGQIHVSSGSFKSRFQTLPASDFPPLPNVTGETTLLSAASLKRLIDTTSYAITDKAQKYVLDGSLLSLAGTVMAMVATDGKRLSISTSSRVEGPESSVILPNKTLDLLFAHCDQDIEFLHTDRHLFFVAGKRVLISRMLEGQFPKYERIIPRDCDKNIIVDRILLTSALRRVGVVSDDKQAVYLSIEPSLLTLTSRSAGVGDADEQVAIEYNGDAVKTCVNGRYVLDFLEKAVERTISIGMKTENDPLLFTDGRSFINVILGMR